jgi:TonB C terminal
MPNKHVVITLLLLLLPLDAIASSSLCQNHYDQYLNDVRRQIFSQWQPAKSSRSYRVTMHLSIGKQGQLLTPPKLLQPSGDSADDQRALMAARQTFAPLPACQPSKAFDMDITLSYDLTLTQR